MSCYEAPLNSNTARWRDTQHFGDVVVLFDDRRAELKPLGRRTRYGRTLMKVPRLIQPTPAGSIAHKAIFVANAALRLLALIYDSLLSQSELQNHQGQK
jgi:hypothetical protein